MNIEEATKLIINLPESVQKVISENLKEHAEKLINSTHNCESPIEQMLAVSLENSEDRLTRVADAHFIEKQHVVKVNDKRYRADFYISAANEKNRKTVDYIIECDGHDFHEKTKEQAQKDKKRDRDLTHSGYKVLRFTGSEIYKDSKSVANEIMRIIIKDLLVGD